MTISIHDGVIIGYSVNFMENELRLDIETVTKEIVTVTFENYLAHHFDHVMAGSILFDIEEVDSINSSWITENNLTPINYTLGRLIRMTLKNT